MTFYRIFFVAICTIAGYVGAVQALGDTFIFSFIGLIIGLFLSLIFICIEYSIKKVKFTVLIGGIAGVMISLVIANMVIFALPFIPLLSGFSIHIYFKLYVIMGCLYVGVTVGANKTDFLDFLELRLFKKEYKGGNNIKIFDTSVIIDGRIADICETGFIEGDLVIPKFILNELQKIADSSDSLKRNRGRRGLDILQRMQKSIDIDIKIIDDDFPKIKEVDTKLVALGQKLKGKVVTNDFNLNKVAELQGVSVLNINQLTNSVKPVVLPGEIMNVLMLKEGKEYGQGVAYLDDGTMVVVDNGKKMIGQTIDVLVKSVLQTTAGRMIFAKVKDEENDEVLN